MPTEKEYLAKKTLLATKQDKLTAGANITISPSNVISSTGGGSQVSVIQKVAQGENIADITIDGITTRLYASAGMDGNAVYTGTTIPTANIGEDGDLYYQYEIEQGSTIVEIVADTSTSMPYTSLTDITNCNTATVKVAGGYGSSWFQDTFTINIDDISTDSQDPSTVYTINTYDGTGYVYCYNDGTYLNFSYTYVESVTIRALSFVTKDTYKKTAIYTKDNDVWEENLEESGDNVSITPTLSTGTKIADYEIDGVTGELYAPTGGGGTGNVDDVYVNGTSVLDSNHIAQIKSYKELTQAEYDALPSSKLTDDIMYCITDAGITEGDTFAPIIYSLTEREVGVWVDNKPIYQKTLVGSWNLDGERWSSIITNIPNGELCKIECLDTDRQYIGMNGNIDPSGNLTIFNLRSTSLTCSMITLWYTKSTDTAGSGSYNTLGVPTVHYSTDEQIIGTWIDGTTIYEKTFDGLSQPTNGDQWVIIQGVNVPNIKDLINCKAWGLGSSNEQIKIALAEYSSVNDGVRVSVFSSSWNRTITKLTIQYTKTI